MKRFLIIAATLSVAAVVTLATANPAHAASCGSAASPPNLQNGIIGSVGSVSCSSYNSSMYLEVCVQSYDFTFKYWYDIYGTCVHDTRSGTGFSLTATYPCSYSSFAYPYRTHAYATWAGGGTSTTYSGDRSFHCG